MIAITTGDHTGIGPEVISKGLRLLRNKLRPQDVVVFGQPRLYVPYRRILPSEWKVWSEEEVFGRGWKGPSAGRFNLIVPDLDRVAPRLRDAYACGRYVELATKGALSGLFSALVTGPIDKNELRAGGYRYDGHTEMLRDLCGAPSVTMMMAGPRMRVTLATTHVPLRKVSAALSTGAIRTTIENTAAGLRRNFGIRSPRLAVLGLNPHAGDAGLFGNEESTKIRPAIHAAQKSLRGCRVEGPFPPDGFFAQWNNRHRRDFDAVVCMYHDQGLIPVKLLDFENTVNLSLGLPIVRTSVDHGVGRDIAGKNVADPSSFKSALEMAIKIVRRVS